MVALRPIESHTLGAIYKAYEANHEHFDSIGLAIGSMGEECERRLWLGFRWAHEPESLDGKKIRLFDTGNREETRLLDDLIRAGITVTQGEDGKQIKVRALGGHLRGKLDGEATGVPEAPKAEHVVECKTANDKTFKAISVGVTSRKDGSVSKGVKEQKPSHYAQVQIYMHLRGKKRCLYLLVSKNTDEIYVERIEYDPAYAMKLMAKAERVITANRAPSKISDDPAKYPCIMCPAASVCHGQAFGRNNCRTCIHSSPIMDGEAAWRCERFGKELSVEDQKKGCPAHLYLPELVPGEQIDAGDDWVAYKMPDGSMWRDGVAEAVE
ncbi:MAG: oxidoreductase [Xanthobacteraceae bacterium]